MSEIYCYSHWTTLKVRFLGLQLWAGLELTSVAHSLPEPPFPIRIVLSRVRPSAAPWTVAREAPLSSIISQSLLKFMSIELVMQFNHLIPFSSCLQSFPASGSFPVSWLFASGTQNISALASASVLPMNIQGWSPLGLTGLISLQSKVLSRVFSSTKIQKHQFFSAQLSLWSNSHIHLWLLDELWTAMGWTSINYKSSLWVSVSKSE